MPRCFSLMKTQDGLLKCTRGFIFYSFIVSSRKRKSDNAIGEKQIENTSIMFYLFFFKWYFYPTIHVSISNWIRDHSRIVLNLLNFKWWFCTSDLKLMITVRKEFKHFCGGILTGKDKGTRRKFRQKFILKKFFSIWQKKSF